jgi:hypothetical protein
VDNKELIEVNGLIRNHPVEEVGAWLRESMTAMKKNSLNKYFLGITARRCVGMCIISLVFYCFGLVNNIQFNDIRGAYYVHSSIIK